MYVEPELSRVSAAVWPWLLEFRLAFKSTIIYSYEIWSVLPANAEPR